MKNAEALAISKLLIPSVKPTASCRDKTFILEMSMADVQDYFQIKSSLCHSQFKTSKRLALEVPLSFIESEVKKGNVKI